MPVALGRGLGRHPLAVAGLVVVVLAFASLLRVAGASPQPPPAGSAAVPADHFMQSVVTRDGALGWQQLCPSVQSQLPEAELVGETQAVRAADRASGTTLDVQFAQAQPRPEGGQLRSYLVTARRANGQVDRKTFVVRTQASGCVEAVD